MPFVPLDQAATDPRRPRSGFIPLSEIDDGEQATEDANPQSGFIPLEPERPSVLRNVLLNNPATAIGETAMSLGSQMVALPAAGLAGIGTAAANAMGLTDKEPADVVHAVGDTLTYQPRGEMGQAATEAAMYPFQKLAEGGQYVGNKVLDATGSPLLATAADTVINALPMVIAPAWKAGKAGAAKVSERFSPSTEAIPPAEPRGFIPLEDVADGSIQQARAQRLAGDDPAVFGAPAIVLEELWRQRNQSLPAVGRELRSVPPGHGAGADSAALAWTAGRESGVLPRELRLDDTHTADASAPKLSEGDYLRSDPGGGRSGATGWPDHSDISTPTGERIRPGDSSRQALSEFDLADAQRRDAAASRMGEANRRVEEYPVAADSQARHAPGTGFDANPRSGFTPLRDAVDASAHEAATSRLNDIPQPTPAQVEAGNYKKGAVKLHGLLICMSN